MEKIVDGRLSGWFKERVLLDQAYEGPPREGLKTITDLLGSAQVVRFAQVVVGAQR